MTCDEILKLTDLYIDGAFPAELIVDFEAHLTTCKPCATEVQSLKQSGSMLHSSTSPTVVPPAFLERTTARLYDVFADRLHSSAPKEFDRQWTLPFLYEDEPAASREL